MATANALGESVGYFIFVYPNKICWEYILLQLKCTIVSKDQSTHCTKYTWISGDLFHIYTSAFLADIYLFKVNYRNTKTSCEIRLKVKHVSATFH